MEFIEELDSLCVRLLNHLLTDPVFGKVAEGTVSREHLGGVYNQMRYAATTLTSNLHLAAESMHLYASDDARFATPAFARFKTPFYRDMANAMQTHGNEEAGHDQWLVKDLLDLGFTKAQMEAVKPGPAISSYIALLRSAATGPCPIAFWGFAYVLEELGGNHSDKFTKNLIAKSGIPNIEKAVRFFRGHAESDVDHMEQVRERMRAITDPSDRQAALFYARSTIETWAHLGWDVYRGLASMA